MQRETCHNPQIMRQSIWRRPVLLQGQHVLLRTARQGDQGVLERLRADPEIDHYMGVDSGAGGLLWRHVYLGDQSGALADLAVVRLPNTPIGLVSLWDRMIPHKAAELSIWIGRDYRNAGMGTEALCLALRHAFSELKLHKVYLRVLEYNRRAIRLYEKCGFATEGILRGEMLVHGQWHDLRYMGILADEFERVEMRLRLPGAGEHAPDYNS